VKRIRMVGVVVGVVALFAALTAAGSASAATLCKVRAVSCPPAERYPAETAIKAQLRPKVVAEFRTNIANISCTSSKIEGKTTAASGSPLPLQISEVSFGGCNGEGLGSCTFTTEHLPFAGSISASSTLGNGTFTLSGGGSGAPYFHMACGGGVQCIFASPALSAAVVGGNPANLTINQSLERIQNPGYTCPSTVSLMAEWEVTTPKPLFVSSEP
jgi:hypothetical protein